MPLRTPLVLSLFSLSISRIIGQQSAPLRVPPVVRTIVTSVGSEIRDGTGTNIKVWAPHSILIKEATREIYWSSNLGDSVRRISTASDPVESFTIAGKPGERDVIDGVGEDARFTFPEGMTWTGADQTAFYVCQPFVHNIKRVNILTRNVTNFIFNGMRGFVDGSSGVAQTAFPQQIILDPLHSSILYLVSFFQVRKIDLNTQQVTSVVKGKPNFAGSPVFGAESGVFKIPDTIYATEFDQSLQRSRLLKINVAAVDDVQVISGGANGGLDGTLSNARFWGLQALISLSTSPGGILYAVDSDNNAIRQIDLTNDEVTTLIGNISLSAPISQVDGVGKDVLLIAPQGLVNDPVTGDLFFTEDRINNNAIRTAGGPSLSPTMAPTCTPTSDSPTRTPVTFSPIIDVREVSTLTGNLFRDYVDGPAASARLSDPGYLALQGNVKAVFWSNPSAPTIRKLDLESMVVFTVAGVLLRTGTEDGPLGISRFQRPTGIDFIDAFETKLYIADLLANQIRQLDTSTNITSSPPFSGASGFIRPVSISTDSRYDFAYVAEERGIRKVDLNSLIVTTLVASLSPQFRLLRDLFVTGDFIFATDDIGVDESFILQIDSSTGNVTTLSGGFDGMIDGTVSSARYRRPRGIGGFPKSQASVIYVADRENYVIRRIDLSTNNVTIAAGTGFLGSTDGSSISSDFAFLMGLDVATNGGDVFFSENMFEYRVRVLKGLTLSPSTLGPLTAAPTTGSPTHSPVTVGPTTTTPTTLIPSTCNPSTVGPTTMGPTTLSPTTHSPSTSGPTTLGPVTLNPSTLSPSTVGPTTLGPTSLSPATFSPSTTGPTTNVPTTMGPSTCSPSTRGPTTLAPSTLCPSTCSPSTGGPTTSAPSTLSPSTRSPSTGSPTTTSPSTRGPSTCSPSTGGPTTSAPSTTSPSTHSPSTSGPTTTAPSTFSPSTSGPTTLGPSSLSPTTCSPSTGEPTTAVPTTSPVTYTPSTAVPTASPVTYIPSTSGPTTTGPTTMSPSSCSPSTSGPTTTGPTTKSPSSCSPSTSGPTTAGPTTKSPSSCSPSTCGPTTTGPTTMSPSSCTPSTYGPTTTGPTTMSPTTISPSSCNPSTCGPTTKAPITMSPTMGPTISPSTCSPSTCGPTTASPVSTSPSTCSPSTTSPSTRNPTTASPTTSPTTNPITGSNAGANGLVGSILFHRDTTETDEISSESSNSTSMRRLPSRPSGPPQECESLPPGTLTRAGGSILLTLSGEDRISLVASPDVKILGPDRSIPANRNLSCPKISFGRVFAEVTCCSESNLTFIVPTIEELCPGDMIESCGYDTSLNISLPEWNRSPLGANLSCPGLACPGFRGAFHVARQCHGFDPVIVCAENYREGRVDLNCAFSANGECIKCDGNAFCPGGRRMWPKQGFFTPRESIGTVRQCPAPSSERCLGWDTETSQSRCGDGYNGPICAECENGHYLLLRSCLECDGSEIVNAVATILILVLIVAAAVLLVLASECRISLLDRKHDISEEDFSQSSRYKPPQLLGANWTEILRWESGDYFIWAILQLQLYYPVVRTAGKLSRFSSRFFGYLNIVALDFQIIAMGCHETLLEPNGLQFAHEYAIFTVVLVVMFLSLVLRTCGKLERMQPLQSMLSTMLHVLYLPATYRAFAVLQCMESYSDDGTEIHVTRSQPGVECYASGHTPVAALAVIVIILFSVLTPCLVYLLVARAMSKPKERDNKQLIVSYWRTFGDDARFFERGNRTRISEVWTRPLEHLFFIFVLCGLSSFLSADWNNTKQEAKFIFEALMFGFYLLAMSRPYSQFRASHKFFKSLLQVPLFVILILASSMEYCNFLIIRDDAHKNAFTALETVVVSLTLILIIVMAMVYFDVAFCKELHLERRGLLNRAHFLTKFIEGKVLNPEDVRPPSPSRLSNADPETKQQNLSQVLSLLSFDRKMVHTAACSAVMPCYSPFYHQSTACDPPGVVSPPPLHLQITDENQFLAQPQRNSGAPSPIRRESKHRKSDAQSRNNSRDDEHYFSPRRKSSAPSRKSVTPRRKSSAPSQKEVTPRRKWSAPSQRDNSKDKSDIQSRGRNSSVPSKRESKFGKRDPQSRNTAGESRDDEFKYGLTDSPSQRGNGKNEADVDLVVL